jgi:hypothetical protein
VPEHPLESALVALRKGILAASPKVKEGVKWNAPSFYVDDERYFATASIHARGKPAETVLLVLHRGAKAKSGRVAVKDPASLLEWLGTERAVVRFESLADVRAKLPALQRIIRAWITQLGP